MRIRPRLYESLHENLAEAIGAEIQRRGLDMTAACRLAGWSGKSTPVALGRFVRGDTRALGHLAAMKVAEALGLHINYQIAPTSRASSQPRIAA